MTHMQALNDVSWSTDGIHPGARLAAWRNFVGDVLQQCSMDYTNDDDGEFWARMTWGRYGDISIGKISGSKRKGVRSPELAKNTGDGVTMSIACDGRYNLKQARREILLERGGANFFHHCLPGVFEADNGGEYWVMSLPARIIAPRLGDSSSLVGRSIDSGKPQLRLLTAYLNAVYQTAGLDDPKTKAVIGSQVLDMIVAVVGTADESVQANAGRGVRAARFKLAMDEIRRRHSEPMLNGERLARAVGLSTRYVQLLFEENGCTLSAEITNERLRAARKALADPSNDGQKISDIAFRCGFSDLSYFNRAYRQKYGETPKAARG
jgi:AraC-like DNA-binding protein